MFAEHTLSPCLPFRYTGLNRILGPSNDASQDITATSAVFDNGVTAVTFRRERVTNDPNDVPLDQCVYFLYAWGGVFNVSTQTIQYHGGNREPSRTMVCLPSSSVCPGEWNVHGMITTVCMGGTCYVCVCYFMSQESTCC